MEYQSLEEFYPFYLEQHTNRNNRRLHVIGIILAFLQLAVTLLFSFGIFNLLLVPIIGYGFAWIGHYFFESETTKPTTFKQRWMFFKGDLRLTKEIVTGQR
jgi:hypothetical protein